MTDFYRKVNKFFQKFAKCDPCQAVASSVNEKPVAKIPQVTQAHYLCHVRVSYNMRTYGAKFRSGNVLENGNKNR